MNRFGQWMGLARMFFVSLTARQAGEAARYGRDLSVKKVHAAKAPEDWRRPKPGGMAERGMASPHFYFDARRQTPMLDEYPQSAPASFRSIGKFGGTGRRFFPVASALVLAAGLVFAAEQAKPQTPEDGSALAAELRAQAPTKDFQTSGRLKMRDGAGKRSGLHIALSVQSGAKEWQSIYDVGPDSNKITQRLTIIRQPDGPSQYLLSQADAAGVLGLPVKLSESQVMASFAGSDFWPADLGMDFFRWPQQRILKKEMRKSRPCKVLESVNPQATPGVYARVLSWIDNETGGLLRAEAYNSSRLMIKEFSLRSFSKINGRWQLKEMEIRNPQTDSVTRLEFDLEIAE